MRLRLSLSAQILILVTLPLIFQLASLVLLASLQGEAEQELGRANRAAKISDEINKLNKEVYDYLTTHQARQKDASPDIEAVDSLDERLRDHFGKLAELTRDNPEMSGIVRRSQNAGMAAIASLRRIKASYDRDNGESANLERKPMWKQLQKECRGVINEDILNLRRNQKEFADASTELQAKLRKQMQTIMLVAGVMNLLLTLVAAIYLTRGIATKVKRLNDNTYRLASDMPLNPPLPGSDELAKLDSVFHKMAAELKEAARKQRALVDGAHDLICSIDSAGRFTAANPACEKLLAYQADEILGKHLVDLIVPSDVNKTLTYLDQIKDSDTIASLETRMKGKGGIVRDVLFSAQYSKEEGSTFCIVYDISQRKEAERLRQEVVAMVTHDLRTPLSTVCNVLDFLGRGVFGTLDEKGMRYVESGQRNVERMMTLINDLLDIERIKSGRMELTLSIVSLQKCFDDCRDLHTRLAEEAGVEIEVEPSDVSIKADAEKLQRLLSNLVSNSIKFSPDGGKVTMSASQNHEFVVISVSDEGSGIPAEKLEHVFERFLQADRSNQKTGSGLGLAICKAIAEVHGGKIWVESEKGKGSIFSVELPLK